MTVVPPYSTYITDLTRNKNTVLGLHISWMTHEYYLKTLLYQKYREIIQVCKHKMQLNAPCQTADFNARQCCIHCVRPVESLNPNAARDLACILWFLQSIRTWLHFQSPRNFSITEIPASTRTSVWKPEKYVQIKVQGKNSHVCSVSKWTHFIPCLWKCPIIRYELHSRTFFQEVETSYITFLTLTRWPGMKRAQFNMQQKENLDYKHETSYLSKLYDAELTQRLTSYLKKLIVAQLLKDISALYKIRRLISSHIPAIGPYSKPDEHNSTQSRSVLRHKIHVNVLASHLCVSVTWSLRFRFINQICICISHLPRVCNTPRPFPRSDHANNISWQVQQYGQNMQL